MNTTSLRVAPPLLTLLATLTALPAAATDTPDPRARTLAATCANCHGTTGQAQGALTSLAGRPAAQTLRSLDEFRDGRRPATIMHQIVKGYRADELQLIADHFARQEP